MSGKSPERRKRIIRIVRAAIIGVLAALGTQYLLTDRSVGDTVQQLIADHGEPDRIVSSANGKFAVYVYQEEDSNKATHYVVEDGKVVSADHDSSLSKYPQP